MTRTELLRLQERIYKMDEIEFEEWVNCSQDLTKKELWQLGYDEGYSDGYSDGENT